MSALIRSTDASARALQALMPRLQTLTKREVLAPRVRTGLVLADLTELVHVLARPVVRQRLLAIGVERERFEELKQALEALREAENQRVRIRGESRSRARSDALQRAAWLRDELLAACRWNLRSGAPGGALERITDSDDPIDLAQDLRELVQLIQDNAGAFRRDRSFNADVRCTEAQELGRQLRSQRDNSASGELDTLGVSPDEASSPRVSAAVLGVVEDTRNRAFTHAWCLAQELRDAGLYAFRGHEESRRLFLSSHPPHPRRQGLSSTIRALAG